MRANSPIQRSTVLLRWNGSFTGLFNGPLTVYFCLLFVTGPLAVFELLNFS